MLFLLTERCALILGIVLGIAIRADIGLKHISQVLL